jgi:integrase
VPASRRSILTRIGDYDEQERRIRLRASTTKTRRSLWVDLPEVLADALEATLPPPEDRDLEAPLFPDCGADRLRTAIARSCKASGIPVFSPHDLRHRRISLLHRQGRTWAEIGRLVGPSGTVDHCGHVHARPERRPRGRLSGADPPEVAARTRMVRTPVRA